MSWQSRALEVMYEIYIQELLSGTNRKKIADAIDDAYPFGERKNYPYKAWLKARKKFFSEKSLPHKRDRSNTDKQQMLLEI